MNFRLVLLAVAALLSPVWGQAEPAAQAGKQKEVSLAPAAQARAGVRVQRLAAASMPRVVAGFARVMDTAALAALDAELGTAQAAAAASAAELRRVRDLAAADQAASARAVDAARAQAEADQARATLASRRLGLEWGPGIARQAASARSGLLRALARGDSALLRVDLLSGADWPAQARLRVYPGGADRPVGAVVLGPAANADARLQTPGVLALVRGPDVARLPAGLLLRAEARSAVAESGTVLPRSALLRAGGAVWAYVQTGPEGFVRRRVAGGRPVAAGWFVTSGFKAGDLVVADGAASLFAAEFGGEAE